MSTTARLLLPFTGEINTQAINCAIQIAVNRQAILVPVALVPVRPNGRIRLEFLQQAQDFLEFTRHKAERQGVPVEPVHISTGNTALSIEAIAGEMECEAVLIFLCNTAEVLLGHAEIRTLMDHSNCNMLIVLFPEKCKRRTSNHLLLLPFLRRSERDAVSIETESLLEDISRKHVALVHYPVQTDRLH